MKRIHTLVSRSEAGADTPLPVVGKKCRQQGLVGTPVEGLTAMPVDAPTPDSEGLQCPQIPDTTLRRVEGFCLNTPLTLSQAAAAETPTFGKDSQTEKSKQHDEQHQHQAAGTCAGAAVQQRHRLANISNLPRCPRHAAPRSPSMEEFSFTNEARPMDCSTGDKQQQQQQSRQHRRVPQKEVTFEQSLLSPPASLPGPYLTVGTTPYPASGSHGCAAACDDDDDCGFVLHSQPTYSRSQQPAISPSVAAGLSVPDTVEDDEQQEQDDDLQHCFGQPFTTPSQDTREPPRNSPSNITYSNATASMDHELETGGLAVLHPVQQMQQRLPRLASQHSAALPAAAAEGPGAGPSRLGSNNSSQSVFHNSFSSGGGASCTPGDALALPLGDDDQEETATPELEQIGFGSQDIGGSQLSAGAGSSRRAIAPAAPAGQVAAAAAGTSSRGGVVCEEVTAKQVLFPIFRPKSTRKCVILVRHGESTYNKMDTHGKQWGDPLVYDAPLTAKGRQQAQSAHASLLEKLNLHAQSNKILWLTSPLTRAIETMMLAFPDVEALAQGKPGSSGIPLTAQPTNHKVKVLSMIAEHCATCGDVGRPASKLAQQFPALAKQLAELPEQWWFNPCQKDVNCAEKRLFGRKETIAEMQRRVSQFSRWLGSQPEQVVVAFGHSTFWKYFSNSKNRMKNCEVLQLWW